MELIFEAATILLSMSSSPSPSGGMDSGSGTDSKLFISTSSENANVIECIQIPHKFIN